MHARAVAVTNTPQGGADFRIPLEILTVYTAGALIYVGIYNGTIGLQSIVEHPLLGVTFVMPILIFVNEVKRDRDWLDEIKDKDGYGVFRVNVIVSITLAAAGMMSRNTKVQVTSLAMAMAAVIMPMTTSLPGSAQGATIDAVQRVAIVSSTWAVVGVVAKELLEQGKMKWP